MTINSINQAASPTISLIESERRGEINNINKNHDVQFHMPENSKKTSPQLPPELINMVLKNAMNSSSSIEFIHLLTVCMKVNRYFYCCAKEILKNPAMCAIWDKNKKFFHILELCVYGGVVPEKERDGTVWSYFESAYSNVSIYSNEQINFASKYIRKRTSSRMLGFITEEFCEIKRILSHGQRTLEVKEVIHVSLKPSRLFSDQAHKALLDVKLTPFTLPDIELPTLTFADIELPPITLPDIERRRLSLIGILFQSIKDIFRITVHAFISLITHKTT